MSNYKGFDDWEIAELESAERELRDELSQLAGNFDTSGFHFDFDYDGTALVTFGPNLYFGAYVAFEGAKLAELAGLDRRSATYRALAEGRWVSFSMYYDQPFRIRADADAGSFVPSATIWFQDIAVTPHDVQPTEDEEKALSAVFVPLFINAAGCVGDSLGRADDDEEVA